MLFIPRAYVRTPMTGASSTCLHVRVAVYAIKYPFRSLMSTTIELRCKELAHKQSPFSRNRH
jgi:hypothetical protein